MAVTSEDMTVLGSGMVSGGNMTLAAGYSLNDEGVLEEIEGSSGSVTLQGALDNSEAFSHTRGSSFFGLNNWSNGFDAHETRNIATTVNSGGDLDVLATDTITLSGSATNSDGNILFQANNSINLLSEETEYYRNDYASFSGFGVFNLGSGGGGMNIGIGYMATNDETTTSGTVQNGSSVDALGDISMQSGDEINIENSSVYGDGSVLIEGDTINITTATETANRHELHESLFIGGQISVTNNMFGAVDALGGFRDSTGNINNGYGAANAAFAGFRAYDAVQSAMSSPLGASIGLGFSYSSSETQSSSNTEVGSDLFGGESLTVISHAGDISSYGGNFGSDGTLTLDAAQTLLLTSAISSSQNSSENTSAGGFAGFGIGAGGLSPTGSLNFSMGESDGWTRTHTNTHLNGTDVILSSGGDTHIAGGVVEGDTINVEVGGDFDLHSLQDTGERSNSSMGFGVGFGSGGISSVTPSFGIGSGSTAWVSEQTGLFSSGDTDVSVGGATDILGSVIGSSEGNVTVDTETLTHANLSDHNVYNDVGVSVTLSAGLWTPPKPAPVSGANGAAAGQNGEDQGGNPLCASIGGCTSPNWTTQGHYAFDDSAQNTNATIGTGEGGTVSVTIRDTEAQQDLEDSGQTAGVDEINSDLSTAQVVTRDEHERIDFYLSDSSIKAAVNAVSVVGRALSDVTSEIFGALAAQGDRSFAALNDAKNNGLLTDESLLRQLATCGGGQRQGFNLWNMIFSTAYAASTECEILLTNGTTLRLSNDKVRSCLEVYLGIAIKDPKMLTKLEQALQNIPPHTSTPHIIKTIGVLKAIYNDGPVTTSRLDLNGNPMVDDYGDPLILRDNKGRFLYKNTISGEYFWSNPNDPQDIVVADAASMAAGLAVSGGLVSPKPKGTVLGSGGGSRPHGRATPRSCFIAGTPVWTPQGFQAIETIRVGDIVLSRDEAGRMTRFSRVDKVFVRKARVLRLVLEDKTGKIEHIGTTRDHPFHVPGKGFVLAGDLVVGMKISTVENWKQPVLHQVSGTDDTSGFLRVKSLTLEDKITTVYNFEVAGTHTYFVGKSRAWVHNADCGDKTPSGLTHTEHSARDHQAGGRPGFTDVIIDGIVGNNRGVRKPHRRDDGIVEMRTYYRDSRGNTVVLNDDKRIITVFAPTSNGNTSGDFIPRRR